MGIKTTLAFIIFITSCAGLTGCTLDGKISSESLAEVLPKAVINGLPAGVTTQADYSFSITGLADPGSTVVSYKYKIEPKKTAQCADLTGYGSWTSLSTPLAVHFSNSGPQVLCVLALDDKGKEQVLTAPTSATLGYDAMSTIHFGPQTERVFSTDSFLKLHITLDYPKPYDLVLKFNSIGSGSGISSFLAPTSLQVTIPAGETQYDYLFYTLAYAPGTNSDINYVLNLESANSSLLNYISDTTKRWVIGDYANHNQVKFKAISGSEDHLCAINFDGDVYCWGDNYAGQLGIGNTTSQNYPILVPSTQKFISVDAGSSTSCAIDTTNHIWCWGDNSGAEFGNGTTVSSKTPVAVDPTHTYKMLSVTGYYVCAIDTSDKLWCWGDNGAGQLGIGNLTKQLSPAAVTPAVSYKYIATGGSTTCAIDFSDQLWCWGFNTSGQIGNGTTTLSSVPVAIDSSNKYLTVATRDTETCAITLANKLRCWGDNWSGQLGDGTTTSSLVPVDVADTDLYKKVEVGNDYVCAITTTDYLKCWGYSGYGRIGTGAFYTPQYTPQTVGFGEKYLAVSPGYWHGCAIDENSYLKCWGSNYYSTIMDGSPDKQTTPLLVTDGYSLSSVSVGNLHFCTLDLRGQVKCAGTNDYGELGNGSLIPKSYPNVSVSSADTWQQISAGDQRTCGLTSTGVVKCWGSGTNGALGTGDSLNQKTPTAVSSALSFTSISMGGSSGACAISTSSELYCWGNGVLVPTAFDAGKFFLDVQMGNSHACALQTNGKLRCWGSNWSGQVGDGTTTTRATPVDVDIATTYKSIALHEQSSHSCAIDSTDHLRCWGSNGSGQVGDGTTTQKTSPTLIDASTTYKQVAVGRDASCAIDSTNKLHCWGSNAYGQLGLGDTTKRLVPTLVSASQDFKKVFGGFSSVCALDTNDTLWCWGAKYNGLVGDGWSNSYSPRHVLMNLPQ